MSVTASESVDWLEGKPLTIEANAHVKLVLTSSTSPPPWEAQSDIQLSASLSEECGTELVPSYTQPLQDSYYPTVSGAAVLHSHGFTGNGITVAILDSGFWEQPGSLTKNTRGENRIRARFDATTGSTVSEAKDESGHGTHMLSVLGRSDVTERSDAPLSELSRHRT